MYPHYSNEPDRYYTVEDPSTDRTLIVDSLYRDSFSRKLGHRVVAVAAESSSGLDLSVPVDHPTEGMLRLLNAPDRERRAEQFDWLIQAEKDARQRVKRFVDNLSKVAA